jgi:hypothetical protein
MPRINEKLEFATGHAVKVSAKAWIGREAAHKNPGILVNLQKNTFETSILDCSG